MPKYYLCITPFFPSPTDWRGAYVLDQVRAIIRNSDYKVVVLRPCPLRRQPKPYTVDGIEVFHIPSWFMPSNFFNGVGDSINGRKILTALKGLGIKIDEVVVAHAHTSSFACYLTGLKQANPRIKTVLQHHDLDPYQTRLGRLSTWKPNIVYRINKIKSHFHNVDLHLCISEQTRYNLEHFPNPHPDEAYIPYIKALSAVRNMVATKGINSYVLYNGVDVSLFYPQSAPKDKAVFKIGCIANFQELKDHITLIKAVELVIKNSRQADILVSFIGSGETRSFCQDYIESKGLGKYFIFEPEVTHDRLPEYYNSLDLFVLPSYFEGFGCVYMEAAACGVPFVGCFNQGYSEYIPDEDKDLWLIKPHDSARLAEIIERQLSNPLVQRYEHSFDIDKLVGNYLVGNYIDFVATL